jgi:hypothetical protein
MTEVVWETLPHSDSVEFVDYLTLKLINISEPPTRSDLGLNYFDLLINDFLHPDLHLRSFFIPLGLNLSLSLSLRIGERILISFRVGLFNLEDLPLMVYDVRDCWRWQHRLLRDSHWGLRNVVWSSGALNSHRDDHLLDILIGVDSKVAFRRKICLKIVETQRILVLSQHGEIGQHGHRELELSCEPGQIVLEGLLRVVSGL